MKKVVENLIWFWRYDILKITDQISKSSNKMAESKKFTAITFQLIKLYK